MVSADNFIKLCDENNIWADYIDPTSGVPVFDLLL